MNTTVKFLALLFGALAILSSCEKDAPKEPEISKGEIVIGTALPNPDGHSGSAFLHLIGDLTPKTYDNKTALPFTLSDQFVMKGEDIYVLPWAGSDVVLKYSRNANKEISLSGQLNVDANSIPSAIVLQSATKAYLSLLGKGKVWVINPTTMSKIGEIDLTSYGVGDQNPDPSQMIIRGNKLYVALNQFVGGYFPAPDRPYSDVVIINTETNQVEKMITESTSGISQPTRAVDSKQMFMDENNDIYIVCTGGFGFVPGHKCGILRIKNGETEFDNSYQFSISDAHITGESNTAGFLHYVQYTGSGKLFAKADIPAFYSNPPDFVKDKSVISVEIDLYTKTIKKLDFPKGNGFGSVGVYKNNIVFGITSESENGFFTYNPSTEQASPNAIVKTTGTPSFFKAFGEKY